MDAKSVILMVGLLLVPGACVDVPSMKDPSPSNRCSGDRCSVATYPYTGRDLDLVFLIDTSLSMADEQVILQTNFPGLVRVLGDISGGLPNLHLGTITPDLGTAPYNLAGCERPGGDRGRFLKGPATSTPPWVPSPPSAAPSSAWSATSPGSGRCRGGALTYNHCRPRAANDPENMLYPISVYTNTLSQLKDANLILVGAIAGPYEGSLTVGPDDDGNPQLQPTCGPASDGAMPAVRLQAFVESMLQREEDRYWAFTPICAEDFSQALYGLGTRIRSELEVRCLAAPLCGCPDPAFAFGADRLTDLPDAEAAACAPQCTVQDVDADGGTTDLPPCPTDYAGGHPLPRDPSLPVPACFHITYSAQCAVPCSEGSRALGCHPENRPWHGPSRGAELVLSRRADPAPFTREVVSCASLPLTEKSCRDGLDDDVDGRIDAADPDCR